MNTLPNNTTLYKGKYKITETLGQGGFGITYLAEMTIGTWSTKVAIKEFFIKTEHYRDENGKKVCCTENKDKIRDINRWKKKFINEVELLKKINKDRIIKVIELFDENDTVYYSMEYIEGCNLYNYVINNQIDEQDAIFLITKIAEALKVLHDKRILHLDLNPKNIMVRENGEIVLIDFGLSKLFDKNGVVQSSVDIGAHYPGFAPIEQNNFDGRFTPTIDIYPLGANLYRILTKENPPEASKILTKGFDSLEQNLRKNNISDTLINIVKKALEPKPKDRFKNVDKFINALPDVIIDTNLTIIEKLKNFIKKNKVWLIWLGLFIIGGLCSIGTYNYYQEQKQIAEQKRILDSISNVKKLAEQKRIKDSIVNAKQIAEQKRIKRIQDSIFKSQNNDSNYAGGNGTRKFPYIIENKKQLLYFAKKVNGSNGYSKDKYFEIAKVPKEQFNFSGKLKMVVYDTVAFGGYFNGNNVEISGIQGISLFYSNRGVIENLVIKNSEFDSAAVCVQNWETISNVKNYAKIKHGAGIAYNNFGEIEHCTNYGKVEEGAGICIYMAMSGTIKECSNYGAIGNKGNYNAGILSGCMSGVIENCFNRGTISGNSIGGIVSSSAYLSIKNCINVGKLNTKRGGNICCDFAEFNDKGLFEEVYNCYYTNSEFPLIKYHKHNNTRIINCKLISTETLTSGHFFLNLKGDWSAWEEKAGEYPHLKK